MVVILHQQMVLMEGKVDSNEAARTDEVESKGATGMSEVSELNR